MADIFDPQKRSAIMAAIRGHNTKPEILVRSMVHRIGYRFRIHKHKLPGRPDIILPRHRKIIQVHGCFWHAHTDCKISRTPKSNEQYWTPKLKRTVERDKRNLQALNDLGWDVLTVWECEIKDTDQLAERILRFLSPAGL